jgi:ABC-type polysaccharide/polyol phosphate transport system ATPase subunit
VKALFEARNLGKMYKVRLERSLVLGLMHREPVSSRWALRHCDLSVEAGEFVSIVGRNGAGKSTLLKIATGVVQPSEGAVHRPDWIAPLIEVGAGFHQELTGRENVEVNARLLGLRTSQIKVLFDDIVGFAELEHAIDQPVKQYSSGMYMRLGFSIAVHTSPQLFIVDEVLAVGDARFRHRCLDRMEELRRQGVAILFVSHDIEVVQRMSDRALLLESGQVISSGDPATVVGEYHRVLDGLDESPLIADERVTVSGVQAMASDGCTRDTWLGGERVSVRFQVRCNRPTPEGTMSLWLNGPRGPVWHWRTGTEIPRLVPGQYISFEFDLTLNVSGGRYTLNVGIGATDVDDPFIITRVRTFQVALREAEEGSIIHAEPVIRASPVQPASQL